MISIIVSARKLSIAILACYCSHALGDSTSNVIGPSAVQDLATQFHETKQSLVATEQEKRKILGSLHSINRRMKKISQEKGTLTNEMLKVQGNVRGLAKIIAQLEEQIKSERNHLKVRLKVLYKLSGQSFLATLFSQSSSSDVDRSLKFLKVITDSDYKSIKNYQRNVAEYKHKRQYFNTQVAKLVHIEGDIKKREGLLVTEHQAKTKLVSELDASKVSKLASMQTLRQRTREMKPDLSNFDETVLDLLKPSFFENKGQLHPPVTGRIVQDFGLIQDEHYPVRFSHKGWQFQVARGTPVAAVFDGTVSYVGWIDGYGQTLILDHGDHYYTVYAHTIKAKVRAGDLVRKAQVLAEAGSTSRRYGDGIYFEIRHFAEPENPKPWMVSQGVQISATDDQQDMRF